MKKLLTLLLLLCASLLAFDSVEVSDPNITLHKYGYFKTDKNLTQYEALKYTEQNTLSQLPKNAASFGFDSDTYWFLFDASTASNEHFVIAVKNLVATSCELFVFDGDKQVRHDISGYGVPIEKRPFDSMALGFKLEEHKSNITYLVKISSKNPHYTAFEFGAKEVANKAWNVLFFTTTVAFAICAVMIFYNLSLFFALKDTTYLYYCVYIGGFFAFNISALGFLPLISPSLAAVDLGITIGLLIQLKYLGLTLFTIKFLYLDKNNPKLKKQLLYALYFMLFSALLVPIGHGLDRVAVLSMSVLAFFLLYSVGKAYIQGYKPAFFYLIATGVTIICNILFMNMHQGGGLPYNIWTFNIASFGLIWDMFFLSFAIAQRIKIIQQDRDTAERMVEARSRFAVLGETIGSIAHQWRQPLAELGAINTHVDVQVRLGGGISKEELLKSVAENYKVIKYLSSTLDTFHAFFESDEAQDSFDICASITDATEFMHGQFEMHGIECEFDSGGSSAMVMGSREEFFQAFLNILSNAKDAMVSNRTPKPKITITTAVGEQAVVITVEDNGGGIKYDDPQKIFEPYITTKALQGMGIGLFIVKTVVENKMKGTISAENTKEGARFVLGFGVVG